MGWFSWARRTRPAPGRRQGTQGGPYAPPSDHGHLPTPLSADRLRAWFTANAYSSFTDADGDIGGIWQGRLFFFFLFGEHQEILQVRGQWHREAAIERLPELLDLCNEWNADRVWPKAYLRVRDDGRVHAVCEVSTDLEHGVTDDQLGQLLHCGITSAGAFFDDLDERYPDPVGSPP